MNQMNWGRSQRPRSDAATAWRNRSRHGWVALSVGAVLAAVGLVGNAQASHAADDVIGQDLYTQYAESGNIPVDNSGPDNKVAITWEFPGTPEIIFADGPQSPSVIGFNAPGYAPITKFTYEYTKTKALGYCLEPGTGGSADVYNMITPSEYLEGTRGTPEPNTSKNLGLITWIAQNAYPAVDAETFSRISGINTTNHYDLYNGTQAAIWHFTSGKSLIGGSPWTIDVYKWLITNAKIVAPAGTGSSSFTVDGSSARTQTLLGNTLVGPLVVKTSKPLSQLRIAGGLPQGATLTDERGAALPATLTDGAQVYVTMPKVTTASSATVSFSAQGPAIDNGMIVVGKDRYGYGKAQARILSGQPTTKQITTTTPLSWEAATKKVDPQPLAQPLRVQKASPTPARTQSQAEPTKPTAIPSQPEVTVTEQPRPQDPSLPRTGVDSRQTWQTGILGLSVLFLGCGMLLLVRRPRTSLRRH